MQSIKAMRYHVEGLSKLSVWFGSRKGFRSEAGKQRKAAIYQAKKDGSYSADDFPSKGNGKGTYKDETGTGKNTDTDYGCGKPHGKRIKITSEK